MTAQNQVGMVAPIPIVDGGTAVTSVTTSPTASAWAGWDANKNMSAVGFIPGYATTVTAAGTTTLTVGSDQQQYFTGSTTQTVVMPVTSTLVSGQNWNIVNNSSGVVTIQSSGSNTILALPANSETVVTCILASGTTAASWTTSPAVSGSGTVNSGTINDLAYYAATGTAVSALATANNSVLVTSNSGVPSLSTTLPASLLIPSPKISTGIFDSNGDEILALNPGVSPVNFLAIGNAGTGATPQIQSLGSDTNIGFSIASKGTGNIIFGSGIGGQNIILDLIGNVSTPVNFVAVAPAATTGKPVIQGVGSDTNVSLIISGQGTGGILVKGFTNGSAIPAGYFGEIITSNIPLASAVSLTTATAKDVTSLSLTAGNYSVSGNVFLNFPSNTGSAPTCWISTTSATLPDLSKVATVNLVSSLFGSIGMVAPLLTLNISSTTTVYLSGIATFASGTGTACGTITATRIS